MAHKSTIVRSIRFAAGLGRMAAPGLAARALEGLFLRARPRAIAPAEREWMDAARQTLLPLRRGEIPLYSWGAGRTVLLVHGWSGRASQLTPFVAQLVDRGYRVVAFDAPAHGAAHGSGPGSGRSSSLPEFAQTVRAVLDGLGPVHAIIAHSLGAAATSIALAQPECPSVQRLVYVASPEDPGDFLYRAADYLGFGPAVARRTQGRLEQRFDFRFEDARGRALAARIDTPLLIVHDRRDREVSYSEGERLAHSWTEATLRTTEGLGHARILRDPDVIDDVVQFVSVHERATEHAV